MKKEWRWNNGRSLVLWLAVCCPCSLYVPYKLINRLAFETFDFQHLYPQVVIGSEEKSSALILFFFLTFFHCCWPKVSFSNPSSEHTYMAPSVYPLQSSSTILIHGFLSSNSLILEKEHTEPRWIYVCLCVQHMASFFRFCYDLMMLFSSNYCMLHLKALVLTV